jgi:hypothetical protein
MRRPDRRSKLQPIVRIRVVVAAAVLATVGGASCGGGNAASQLVRAPEYAPKGQEKCAVGKSHDRPLVVEWPSSDRLELETKARQGLVVVHYAGCEMDVLERCAVAAKYNYFGGTRKRDTLVMKDADELYANLPVGAAGLEGKLERSGSLTVDMDLVGRYEAAKTTLSTADLQGDCAGATHFVYGVTVGAFEFYAGGEADVGARAGAPGPGGPGAGARSEADRETLTKDGDVGACSTAGPDDKAPPAQCGAMVRLEVVALEGAAAATTPVIATAAVPPVAPASTVALRPSSPLLATATPAGTHVTSVAFSPDGARVAAATYPNGVTFWDASTGASRGDLRAGQRATWVSATTDGRRWLTRGSPGTQLSNIATGDPQGSTLPGFSGQSAALSPDGRLVAIPSWGATDNFVALVDLSSGAVVGKLPGESSAWGLAFSPDGSTLAVGLFDPANTTTLWDIKTRTKRLVLTGKSGVLSAAFSPDGRLLATGYNNNGSVALRLWDASNGNVVADLPVAAPAPSIGCLAFSPNGKLLASCGGTFDHGTSTWTGAVDVWSVATRSLATSLRSGASERIGAVAFSRDGMHLAAGGGGGSGPKEHAVLELWDLGAVRP